MKKLLKKYFGFEEFRPLQGEIIVNVLSGKDTFVLMPTGGGKSLCYQLPALKFGGITLVVSPLIALMKDQVDSLRACGVRAEFINSTLSSEQIEEICQRAKQKKIKILYIAPERFALKNFQNFLQTLDISLIAVDEAHCISEWGHDFRPDYRNLSQLKKLFGSVPLIALTATATDKVQNDIISQLFLQKSCSFVSSFNRENLNISVINKVNAFPKLINLLNKYKNESVIIYCHSRNETEKIVENLKLNKFNAVAYHAGLENIKRKQAQEQFVKDEVNIIVATIAFGMGINKPDVRLVVHYTFPKTLEGYYQEIGRAGRDGLPSECVMFYTYADTRKHEYFINQIDNSKQRMQSEEKLAEVLNFAELTTCRKKYLLKYFGEVQKNNKCMSCDICLTERDTFDASVVARKIASAIVRTNSRFGKNYIIDILLGKKNQKILINKHDQLSVFGIVKDFSANELGQIINQLLGEGIILKSDGKYPVLSVTKKGIEFMQNDEKIELPKPGDDLLEQKKTKINNQDYNKDLFEELRNLRRIIAAKEKVPPFVIFGDSSLREMAYYFPQDKSCFTAISGVGKKKLEKFADEFLKVIKNFSTKRGIKPVDINLKKEKIEVQKIISIKPAFYAKTKELLVKKIPINRIAKNQNIKQSTVINHIEKMIDEDEKIDLEYLKLPTDRFAIMLKAFEECGEERLKPVFEFLKGKYSYDELKLARVLIKKTSF